MSIKGYICGTDVTDIDLGATDVVIYPSIEKLKKERSCWEECGIVEIELGGKYVTSPMSVEQIIKRNKNEKDN